MLQKHFLGINITRHEDIFTVKDSNRRRSNGNKQIRNKHRLHLSCTLAPGHSSLCKHQPSVCGSSVLTLCSSSPHGTQHQGATVHYTHAYFFGSSRVVG